jgi:hypothetical protein
VKTEFLFPITLRLRFAFETYQSDDRRIAHLLFAADPSAVPRLVIPIVIDAVQRQAVRRYPHIL